MITPLDLNATAIALGQYGNISSNSSNENDFFGNGPVFPPYIRTTATVICSLIMGVGVLGNIMVPIVIFKSKDMRNSTNIFLMNLSLADIMVLLVCTPTVLVEVNSRPETWVLGEEMCKSRSFLITFRGRSRSNRLIAI
ncbi:UNVERIFIED_CONTAM: hypothetical protein PYX00_004280 [Menopon gallinae]|uniref:G-protein coupled receptors family 1 profile domain-containing protein n=1 Tax=Menopon gallinae TaxID=328185 RepID=A0AAW2I404_9NEOP